VIGDGVSRRHPVLMIREQGIRGARYQGRMTGRDSSSAAEDARREVAVFFPFRTVLLVGLAVAVAWALASIGDVLLLLFMSLFSVAVLSPVVEAMERRLSWSRAVCSTVLVLGVAILVGAALLVLVQAMVDSVRSFSDDLPQLVQKARDSGLGSLINGGSDSLETLKAHAGDITNGVAKASGGVAHVGASAFGAVTLTVSVVFLTLFGLIDEPRVRASVASLLYRDKRERFERLTDQIVRTTSRYMLGNLAISVICATVYGLTAVILGLPHALALALIAGILDLIPNIGALLAGIIIGLVALSVSLAALIAFAIVIVVYQQVENYILQPTIIGRAARVSGFTVITSVLVFGALFGIVGAVVGVPIAAAVELVLAEVTADRRAGIAADDAAGRQPG
jgi:predicted PurR-regulated permease PerM